MPKGSGKSVTSQGTNQGVSRVVPGLSTPTACVCVNFDVNCRDLTTPTTVMEGIATPTRVAPATTTLATVTGSTTGWSILLSSAGHELMIVVLVDLRAPSPLEEPRTPPTTTTIREPAPPTTREGMGSRATHHQRQSNFDQFYEGIVFI